jgi:primosomal replication protein N
MTEKILNNNQVVVAGEIASDFRFSHEIFGEGFYMVDLIVSRLSDAHDVIPLMVSDRLFDVEGSHIGERILAKGQFRSYNKHEEFRNRLILSVFVREIEVIEELDGHETKPNQIYLDGYICKEPIYRMTPLGREIADILLAVNRAYGKSDYIPCICWGRNARFAGKLSVGEHVSVWGRIQSREYQKKVGNDEIVNKVAYEVSVSKLDTDHNM